MMLILKFWKVIERERERVKFDTFSTFFERTRSIWLIDLLLVILFVCLLWWDFLFFRLRIICACHRRHDNPIADDDSNDSPSWLTRAISDNFNFAAIKGKFDVIHFSLCAKNECEQKPISLCVCFLEAPMLLTLSMCTLHKRLELS